MNICVNCKYHRILNDSPQFSFNNVCTSPNVRLEEEIDPVSGKNLYVYIEMNNDSIKKHFSDIEFPCCKNINKDGKCKHYVSKEVPCKIIDFNEIKKRKE